jgi:hypothetical protein
LRFLSLTTYFIFPNSLFILMKRSAHLIFNPVADQGDPEQQLVQIRAILEPEIAKFRS